jgi:hypothetical protein
MKRFLYKLFICGIPVMLYIVIGEYLLYRYKENVPIQNVAKAQLEMKHESYYSRYFFDSSPTLYKLEMAKRQQADILVIGRSTVLGFRAEMFHPFEKSFYNMGFAVNSVADIQAIVDLIKNKQLHKPRLMLIGIDAPEIKSGILDHLNTVDKPHEDEVYDIKMHFLAFQLLTRELYAKNPTNVLLNRQVGFGYLGNIGQGFRKDGSLLEAILISRSNFHPVYNDHGYYEQLLNNKVYPLDYPYKINNLLKRNLLHCLADIKKLGITPIIFFPPISNDFYKYFNRNKDFRNYFENYLMFQKELMRMKYQVIPFTTPKDMGLNDNYMQDAIHPGEVLVGRIWYHFLQSGALNPIDIKIDTAYLNRMLTAKKQCPYRL